MFSRDRTSAKERPRRITGRVRSWLLPAVVAVMLLPFASHADRKEAAAAKQQIEALVVCYALGTDAIGGATDAVGGQALDSTVNLSPAAYSEGFAEGLAKYQECFADDFSFTLIVNDVPVATVPDPSLSAEPALQWANFVNNAFRGSGYSNTQHHMGTIETHAAGNTGSAQSYLIATHAYGPSSGRTGVNIVGGTYRDDVVRRQGRWLIRSRTLTITSSVNLPAGL